MTLHGESEIMLAIGRLEGKVDTLIQMQRIQEDQIKNHEDRLRQLEHSKSYAMGIAAAIGAVVSTAMSLVTKAL
jgi:TolA-binding protein